MKEKTEIKPVIPPNTKIILCTTCGGLGKILDSDNTKFIFCPACNGTGGIKIRQT